jgi:hypothetical protein
MVTTDLPIWIIKDVNVTGRGVFAKWVRKVGMNSISEVCRWCETGMGR